MLKLSSSSGVVAVGIDRVVVRWVWNATTILSLAVFCWGERGIVVNDEASEFRWDGDEWEEKAFGTVFPPRRGVCWVVLAGNVSSVDVETPVFNDLVYTLEYSVCGSVLASPVPPALDNACIVPPDLGGVS